MKSKEAHVSEEKIKAVADLDNLIKNNRTILLASIKSIPLSQYQEIVKKLRGQAIVKVPKKSIIFRALDDSGIEAVKKLKEHITENLAIFFSSLDPFELAAELLSKKSPAKAKAGQEAPDDIEIPAGPTDLVPGPAISELGALGIQIQIENGKINIKAPKVITKEGEKISSAAADLMSKLNIKPFSIGFIPVAAFDTEEGKLYNEIQIDREATIEQLKEAFGKALPFAVEIGFVNSETIGFMISKAGRQEKALENFMDSEKPGENKEEKEVETKEKNEAQEEKSEEVKNDE